MKDTGLSPISTPVRPQKKPMRTIAQVKSILKEETYIGHSIHNKQSNISFKNKKKGAEAAGRMVSCGKYPRSHHF